jgi:hypothetical protein
MDVQNQQICRKKVYINLGFSRISYEILTSTIEIQTRQIHNQQTKHYVQVYQFFWLQSAHMSTSTQLLDKSNGNIFSADYQACYK